MRVSRMVVVGLVLALAGGLAQVTTARLEGTVQDARGAVVPGAKVEVVDSKTQLRNTTASDAEGRFAFLSLEPSEYTLSVEAAGFRKAVRSSLVLTVAETVREVVKLEVGSVAETVVVEANAVRVQTTDGQIGDAITLRDIDVLPQLGRGPIILAVFESGVQIDPSDTTYSRVNGTRQGANNAMLDGIAANDPVAPRLGLAMVSSTSDTVEEFRVITNGGKAEYGRNAGGQIQMITRSGTNHFHGGAWDYLRNTDLNANNFFNNSSGQPRPTYIRNIFGGRFEGPIKKDRTFFFGSYEGNRTRQQVVRNRTVLTPTGRLGIFRWNPPNSTAVQSYDVVKNDPRGKGIDPAMKKLIDQLPNPNNADVGDGLNTAGYRFNAPGSSYNDQLTVKVDHNVWNGHRAFFRYSWMRTSSIDTTNSAEARYPGQPNGTQGGHRAGWAAGSDWTISSSVVNEFRLGGTKYSSDFLKPRLHDPMIVPNLFTAPIDPTSYSQGREVPYTEITDNLAKVHARHTLKAGVNVRMTTEHSWREDYAWPAVYLTTSYGAGIPSALPSGTSVISSTDRTRMGEYYNDMLGRVSYTLARRYSDLNQYQPAGTGPIRDFKYRESGYFLQDDWRVHPRLTINVGLRYEFFGAPVEASGLQGSFDKVAQMNLVNRMTDLTVKKGMPYYNPDWNNFAPRLGFAWAPTSDGKTAVRGTFGVFYDRMIGAVLSPINLNTPGFSTDVRSYPSQTTDFRFSDGLPAAPQPTAPLLQLPNDRSTTVTVMRPNLRTGYVLHSAFSIQREIARNTTVELGYVGTHGVKLMMHENLNQPRIYEDFLGAYLQLQAYRAHGTPVPASNTMVRLFGSVSAAVSALGSSNIDNNAVAVAANNVDTGTANYPKYAAAGLPDTYLRNYPQFNYAYLGTNDGRSYYNSLQLRLRRQARTFRFSANYTFSKSMDNWASEGNGTSSSGSLDWSNNRLNRGRADFDHTHSFNASVIYTLPVGRNRRFLSSAPGWVDRLAGGWDAGALNYFQSGSVFSIFSGRYTGSSQGGYSWIDFSGDRTIGSLNKSGGGVTYFTDAQKAMFLVPAAGDIGDSGRNAFRGPVHYNVDLTLSKRFRAGEKRWVTFRAEAYNLFNHANFSTPGASLFTPATLGKFSSTVNTARVLQSALRFDF